MAKQKTSWATIFIAVCLVMFFLLSIANMREEGDNRTLTTAPNNRLPDVDSVIEFTEGIPLFAVARSPGPFIVVVEPSADWKTVSNEARIATMKRVQRFLIDGGHKDIEVMMLDDSPGGTAAYASVKEVFVP
jgi:hypothetical protein